MSHKRPSLLAAAALALVSALPAAAQAENATKDQRSQIIHLLDNGQIDQAEAGRILGQHGETGAEGAKKHELTPKQTDQLVKTLRSRFDSADEKLRESIDFADVENSLRAAPEKLFSLQKLEETGGEPQVVGIESGEYIFEDRSAESPSGRRNLNADEAAAQALEFRVDMQNGDAYRAMQETGKFDLNTQSWLRTNPYERKRTGLALDGSRYSGGVLIYEFGAGSSNPYGGWRASLRVKKI